MNKTVVFKGITYKWSEGSADHFPKLSIKVREEIVTFQAADELVVSEKGVENGGQHLKPEEVHKLLAERGDEVVFFDGRNKYSRRGNDARFYQGNRKAQVQQAKGQTNRNLLHRRDTLRNFECTHEKPGF
jgi:predicted sulfurtransferase